MSNTKQPALRYKTRVTLPDGETGIVVRVDGPDVHVLQPARPLGRGPWIFHRDQVVAV